MTNTKKTFAVFAFLIPLLPSAHASFTGNEMHSLCEVKSTEVHCRYFIEGAVDGMIVINEGSKSSGNSKNYLFCLPEQITGRQTQDIAIKFIKENPALRHEPASILVYRSLRTSFPCKY